MTIKSIKINNFKSISNLDLTIDKNQKLYALLVKMAVQNLSS